MSATALRPVLARLAAGGRLTRGEMGAAMTAIFEGHAGDIEIAGFLMALRARGESVDEIVAAAETMRARATRVDAPADVVDTCGTGGDGANTFNISTAAAIIAAGAGARIAKHGNRSVSSRSGSSDLLAALGVNLDVAPQTVARAIEEAGIGFMFAPRHHGAVAHAAAARKALGVRTLFNLLGPLSNPAGARRQVIGVFDESLLLPLAEALGELGAETAWVVHGADGLDEITLTGPTRVAALSGGRVRQFDVTPEEAGLRPCAPANLVGGGPEDNAAALRALLGGAPGAYRDVALLNAAAALIVAGKADDLKDGAMMAAKAVDTGAASAALAALVRITNETSGDGRTPA